MKLNVTALLQAKERGERLTSLTAYDYPTAAQLDRAGIDIILVGDSVGTNVLGYPSEREVTVADMLHHVRAVARAVKRAFILADMPIHSYDTPESALTNAGLMLAGGADGVKVEGFCPEVVRFLVENEIPVCGHLGLNPQWDNSISYKAKSEPEAQEVIKQALELEEQGMSLLVLELIPEAVADQVSKALTVPTIGIGAGRGTDGQVLVINDLLGLNEQSYGHARRYAELAPIIAEALAGYVADVRAGRFPGKGHVRYPRD